MTTTAKTVPLFAIVEAAGDEINPRRANRTEGIEALAASIKAHGLLQSINVVEADDLYIVVAGHRRIAALNMLVAQGDIAADHPVPVTIGEAATVETMKERATAENIVRLPMSAVDEFKAFADLAEAGIPAADIASRFGITEKRVLQRMALGKLSPVILDALDREEINLAAAQAYTLGSIEQQEAHWAGNADRTWNRIHVHHVRHAMTGADNDSARTVEYVTLEAYKAAGGTLKTDLFAEAVYIEDRDLLAKLAAEKDAARVEAWKTEGWSFVDEVDVIEKSPWQYPRLQAKPGEMSAKDRKEYDKHDKKRSDIEAQIEGIDDESPELEKLHDEYDRLTELMEAIEDKYPPQFTPEQKAASGVIYTKGGGQVWYGVQMTEDEPQDGDKPARQEADTISASLSQKLSEAMTEAVRDRVRQDPDLAMRIMLAILEQRRFGGKAPTPLQKLRQPHGMPRNMDDKPFEAMLAVCKQPSPATIRNKLAEAVASFLDFTDAYQAQEWSLDRAAVIAEIGQVDPALHFDAEGYFKGITKAMMESAWQDMGQTAALDMDAKKAALAATLAAKARETGWLPVELRTDAYAGPAIKPEVIADAA